MPKRAQTTESREKIYRSISEVSEEIGVKPHVLRYWETQFSSLRPRKNRAGNRMYRPEDLALLRNIKDLLYDRRFTIEGARRHLLEQKRTKGKSSPSVDEKAPVTLNLENQRILREVKSDLTSISKKLRSALQGTA